MMNELGITIAGNIIVDVVKNIDCYPKIGMLSNIESVSKAVGGCVPNTAINFTKIDNEVPVKVIGKVGNDDYGRYVTGRMNAFGIDTSMVKISSKEPTSFSDVMNLPSGERTFFHARGANAEFSPQDIDLDKLSCDIFHIGYILLLDSFDKEEKEYGTAMAGLLKQVQERGIKTSVDIVSDSSADYQKTIVPALKYCNYAIVNEIESCTTFNLEPRDEDGKLLINNIHLAMSKMAECGVKDKVIVHSKEAGFILDVKSGNFITVPSIDIPKEMIKGKVGAGDSYCAGCLYGLYNGYSDREILEFASAAAICNLFAENSIDGMLKKSEIEKIPEKYGRFSL